jgi:hypothetical protein
VVDSFGLLGFNPVISASRWQLAEILIKKGDAVGAKEQLDALLKQWERADTEFTLLKKIRDERKGLEAK